MSQNDPSKPAFGLPGLGALEKIRMGPGVVGRTTTLGLAFVVLSALCMFFLQKNENFVIGVFAVATVVCAFLIWKAFSYAEKHPDHSVLDGSELVRFRENELAARDPRIIDLKAEPVPNDPDSILIAASGSRDE